MKYDEALKLWGALKLKESLCGVVNKRMNINIDSVRVKTDFYEGYACCGGSDPNCYCSFAESPRSYVKINGLTDAGVQLECTIDIEDFDFATMLKELCEVADGKVEL